MKTNYNFIRRFAMLFVMALSTVGAMAQETYISDVCIQWGGKYALSFADDLPDGFTRIGVDLNDGKGGDYVYLAYKTTTNKKEAISDIKVVTGDSNEWGGDKWRVDPYNCRTYKPARYTENSNGGDMHQGRDCDCRYYLYYTKEPLSDTPRTIWQDNLDNTICESSAITSLEVQVLKPSEFEKIPKGDKYYAQLFYGFYTDSEIAVISKYFSDVHNNYRYIVIYAPRTKAKRHDLEHHARVEATCTTDGNIEYYRCRECNRYFGDTKCNIEYRAIDLELPALGHDWDKSYDETTGAWQLDCKRCKHNEVRKQMCITANEDNVSLSMGVEIDQDDDDYESPNVQYALNGGPWKELTENNSVWMNQGDMVWLRGNNSYFSRDPYNYTWFDIQGSASATGNVTSLIDNTGEGTDDLWEYCFYDLFQFSTLETSPRLNATKLSESCYEGMFLGCEKLREVTLCATDKASVESAIDGWLSGATANGVVHITDELALSNANLQLPANWRTDKVVVTAKEDPDNAGDYYATYYDSQSEYSVKEGTKAYTGIIDGDVLQITAEADNIIPAGEGVLLKGNTADVILTLSDTNKSKTACNALTGSDTDTTAEANTYIFSYGQNGLGFYKYAADKPLGAHKAYLIYNKGNNARGFRMVFEDMDGTAIGIESLQTPSKVDDAIYNLQGVRMNKLQKGINIVNGKKVIIK